MQGRLNEIFHWYSLNLKESQDLHAEELIQVVLDSLDDFLTDMTVIWTRMILTEDGLLIGPEVFKTNE